MKRRLLQLLAFFRNNDVDRATSEDYESFFSTPSGQRILNDLCLRYGVDRPSFVFGVTGKLNLEKSAQIDAAKLIVCDIVQRAKFKSAKAERKTRAEANRNPLAKLPSSATSI